MMPDQWDRVLAATAHLDSALSILGELRRHLGDGYVRAAVDSAGAGISREREDLEKLLRLFQPDDAPSAAA